MKVDWRTETIASGPRRLDNLIFGKIQLFPSESLARNAWPKIVRRRLNMTVPDATSGAIMEIRSSEDKFFIFCRLHPACFHWARALEMEGVPSEVSGIKEPWGIMAPQDPSLLFPKSNLGRYWP